MLSFEDWKKILAEANKLGVETFVISGGEPTLYKQLPDLIRIGRNYGWNVSVNSNGSLITEEYAKKLLEAGLNGIYISLYSPIPEVHDNMRRSKGLWLKATSAIKIFAALEKKYHGFQVRTQTLLCRENYKSFADLLELHYNLGSHSIALAYLEGDFEKKYLLNENEIRYFRGDVIPKAVEFCGKLDISVRDRAIQVIKNIFSENTLSISEWANGIYQPKNKNIPPCQRPKEFTILLANGDVHPCNMIEYTHEPVMGNLLENSLTEIWNSEKWDDFRENLFDKCELCPINIYMGVPLRSVRTTTRFQKFYAAKIKNSKFYPFVKPLIPVYKLLSK
jgi:radical SAM protein with 4Fe4S-binding SPASM domain